MIFFRRLFNSHCVFGFFVLGAVTVYFDFLDNPLVSLGLPLAVLAVRLVDRRALLVAVAMCAACCLTWTIGYALLWVGKWVLASAVLGRDVVGNAFGQAAYRSGLTEEGRGVGGMASALVINLEQLGFVRVILVCAELLLVVSIGILAILRRKHERINPLMKVMVMMLLISLLPVLWFAVLSNHSIIHSDIIANRTWVIALFSSFSGIALVLLCVIEFIQGKIRLESRTS